MDGVAKPFLKLEWHPVKPIKVDDICKFEPWGQDFMCFKIISYGQFDYLFFGSFDYKDTLFAIQTKVDGINYVKVLTEKPQQEFAFRIYKKWDR